MGQSYLQSSLESHGRLVNGGVKGDKVCSADIIVCPIFFLLFVLIRKSVSPLPPPSYISP